MSTMVACEEATSPSDLISNLPDDVLHHILSFLQLDEIIATTFLSRRWRNFWTSFPVLDFDNWPPEKVNRALVLYNAPVVHTFRFCSPCTLIRPPVDSWTHFAVRHDVRVLDLDLSQTLFPVNLHSSVYSCKSLQQLKLKFFQLNLPPSVTLTSLKTLRLYRMTLDAKELDVLTSGCPVLEDMHIGECNQYCPLKIYIANPSLKKLCIQDDAMSISPDKNKLELFAPRLQSLTINGKIRKSYIMKNTTSLASVRFDFSWDLYNEGELEILVGLLRGVSHVKTLSLSNWCVQVLCLREIKGESPLQFNCTKLELTLRCNWHLLGMAYLLKSSKHLEDLVLNTDDDSWNIFSITASDKLITARRELFEDKLNEKMNSKLEKLSRSRSSQHLKTIKINEFMGRTYFSMTGLESMSIDKFIEEQSEEVELIEVLLEKCNMLEKMVVRISQRKCFNELESRAEFLQTLSKRFLLLPRASPHADILVT